MKQRIILLLIIMAALCQKSYSDDVVGKIDDDFSVTPMGQVNYEIPIPVLSGTGGVSPKLSITYNSSNKLGLCGYGFDLTGLSIITRVPQNMLNDGKVGYVNFTSSDRYALDGVRLINTSTVNEYVSEVKNFARITAVGEEDNPTSFIVLSKDGLKYEYSSNTQIVGDNAEKALYWVLTKVSDTMGNYFTITYGGDSFDHEAYPVRIDYTGNPNASLEPYASVRFEYEYNTQIPTTYIYGKIVRRTKHITSIKLYSGEKLIRSFSLDYFNEGSKLQLSQITEYAADGKHKQPTTFNWYNANEFSVTNVNYQITDLIHKATLTVGDYNGDGKEDVLATPENGDAGWTGWRLFISNGSSFGSNPTSGQFEFPDQEIHKIISGDFNGDGYDDIVVHRSYDFLSSYLDLYLSDVTSNNEVTFTFCKTIRKVSKDCNIRVVETNGDGMADLFIWNNDSSIGYLYKSRTFSSVLPLGDIGFLNCSENWGHVELGDFNGDGLTDILNLHNNGYRVMFIDNNGNYQEDANIKGGWPRKGHFIHVGDFNGDGKSDLLVTGWENDPNESGWDHWSISMSNGAGPFVWSDIAREFNSKYKQIIVADINGDGYDDYYAFDKYSNGSNMTLPSAYFNDGTGMNYEKSDRKSGYAMDKWHYYVGDFNGDGKKDYVCTANWINATWNGFQLFLMPASKNKLLSKITDGMGNTTEIGYAYMSDGGTCHRGRTNSYPVTSFASTWPIVSSVSKPNGIGGRNVVTYSYQNALIHKKGRGFLGFEYVSRTDHTTNTTTTTQYEVLPERFIIAANHIENKIGSRLISESDMVNNVFSTLPLQAFWYAPVSVTEKTYDYNSGSLLISTTTTKQYDNYGNLTRMETSNGSITTCVSNYYGNNTNDKMLGRLASSSVTKTGNDGSEVRNAKFEYDETSGLLTKEYTEPTNQQLGFTKTYTRDIFGNIVQSTVTPNNPAYEPRTELTTYDQKGRFIISVTNSLGHQATNVIDHDNGLLLSSTDANQVTTVNSYDAFGRMTKSQTPIACTENETRWNQGHPDAPTFARYYCYSKTTGQPYTIEFYDYLGRIVRKVTESLNNQKVYIDYQYNNKGQLYRTSEPYFPDSTCYWTTNDYDACGRIIRQTGPDGQSYSFAYNGLTTVTTDPLQHQTIKENDVNGNLIESIDDDGNSILYTYNMNGKCTLIEGPCTTISMEYDLMGNRTKLDDPDLGIVTSAYNAYGEMVSQTDSKGTTSFTYDKGGRLLTEERPDMTVSSIYDTEIKGTLASTTSIGEVDCSIRYNYDQWGRTISETQTIDYKTFSTQFTYNAQNQIEQITYPSGLKVKNVYTDGILTEVKNCTTGQVYWHLDKIDARGQVEKETLGNGLATVTTHDAAKGYIKNITTGRLLNWNYEFNAIGNLTKRQDVLRNLTETFEYDALDRLTQVMKNEEIAQQISYDEVGNILNKTGIGSYTYTAGTNRLERLGCSGYDVMRWDSIHYSSFNKITYIKSGEDIMTIKYGAEKSRVMAIRTKDNGLFIPETKYFVGKYYEESETSLDIRKTCYIFAAGKAIAIFETSERSGNKLRYIHHDHLGSVQAYSNENGLLVQELSYDAWGRRRNPATWEYDQSSAWNPRGFGGHEHIDVFDMVNMDGRMYDPVLGRFLSPDPLMQASDFTQGLNRYSYCLNNPLSLIDPSGYSWFSKNWKSIIGAVVGITVAAITAGSGSGVGVAIMAGAAGGAAGALTGALLNGANIGQIAKSTLTGGLIGAASGFLNLGAGDGTFLESLFKHTFSEGWLEGIQGGNAFHGFIMGAVSCTSGSGISTYCDSWSPIAQLATISVLSGTISEIGGGKFANGAATGAFLYLFNDMMHGGPLYGQIKKIYKNYVHDKSGIDFYKSLGGEIAADATANPQLYQNTCAAKLSDAMNKAGLKIPYVQNQTAKGANGDNYFLKASDMKAYFERKWGTPKGYHRSHWRLKNCIVYQNGFEGVSGHVDVFYKGTSAAGAYNYFMNQDGRHQNITTFAWKFGTF